jgi:hypothetical protein
MPLGSYLCVVDPLLSHQNNYEHLENCFFSGSFSREGSRGGSYRPKEKNEIEESWQETVGYVMPFLVSVNWFELREGAVDLVLRV